MVAPLARFLKPIVSLRPLLNRGLPQSELDKLSGLRARMDFQQGIPVNPANRPSAFPEEFSAQAFYASPVEIQSWRVPSGVSPTTRPIPGASFEDVVINPSIAESYMPRIARSQPFEDEALMPWQSGAFEPRRVTVGLRGGGEMDYVPLTRAEVKEIELAVAEDPVGSYFAVLQNYDEARNPADFGRVMEQARILRKNASLDPAYEQSLNSALARASARFGVPQTKFEEIIEPILYRNSPQLPRQVSKVGSELEEVTEASMTSNRFRIDTNKAIKAAKKSSDLDDIDTNNRGLVGRALESGEINEMDAKRLIDQVNYTRVRLLQNEGIIPSGFKNNVRAQGGKRGIELLENMGEFSDVRKAKLYKVAIQTAESNDEVAQVYALAISDIRSPALLDELEGILDSRTSYLGRIEGIVPDRLARPVETTIDEASFRQANQAQTELDELRFEADRPENLQPGISVPAIQKNGKPLLDDKGNVVYKFVPTYGDSKGGVINRALFSDPGPRPGVEPTAIRTKPLGTGYVERTFYNAQNSDATIAVAKDFDTAGEILTSNAAKGLVGIERNSAGNVVTYRPLPGQPNPGRSTPVFQINHGDSNYQAIVDDIVQQLNEVYKTKNQPLTINFAGNSLFNLGNKTADGIISAQRDANGFARKIVDSIMDHPQRRFEVGLARSGGQHGYDTAFIKAASENGISTGVSHPSGLYGGVMQAHPLSDELRPIFLSESQYRRFVNGDVEVILKKL